MILIYPKIFISFISLSLICSVAHCAMDGKEIYQNNCSVCHESGLAGAPKFRNKEDWGSRLETKKLQGLVDSAIKGINAMPPKGTCESCQTEDIREAIKYMVPK